MLAVTVAGVAGPAWPGDASWLRRSVGLLIAIGGQVLFIPGLAAFGHSLTPFPTPVEHARLQVGGAFRYVRHPIYGGLILIALGWSLLSSPLTLVPTAALALSSKRSHVSRSPCSSSASPSTTRIGVVSDGGSFPASTEAHIVWWRGRGARPSARGATPRVPALVHRGSLA